MIIKILIINFGRFSLGGGKSVTGSARARRPPRARLAVKAAATEALGPVPQKRRLSDARMFFDLNSAARKFPRARSRGGPANRSIQRSREDEQRRVDIPHHYAKAICGHGRRRFRVMLIFSIVKTHVVFSRARTGCATSLPLIAALARGLSGSARSSFWL